MAIDVAAFEKDRRHLGTRKAVARAFYYRASALTGVSAYRMIVLTLATVNRELLDRVTPHRIQPLPQEQLESFSKDPANRLSSDFVADAIGREDVCIGVLDGHDLASFGWYAKRPTVVEDGVAIHFAASHVYMFHGYTKPAYRGQNLHGLGLAQAARTFAERGFDGVVSLADWGNYASLISAYRAGFQNFGVGLRLGSGAAVRSWTSPGCRRYGVHFEPAGARLYSAAG